MYPYNNNDFFGNFGQRRRRPNQGGFPSSPPGFPGGPSNAPGQFPGGEPLRPPTSPPPNFTPQSFTTIQQQEFARRGGVGRIRRCMFRNTFIWLRNGNSFWFYPMIVMGNQIIGYRWRGRRGWVYDAINRNRIVYFQCY